MYVSKLIDTNSWSLDWQSLIVFNRWNQQSHTLSICMTLTLCLSQRIGYWKGLRIKFVIIWIFKNKPFILGSFAVLQVVVYFFYVSFVAVSHYNSFSINKHPDNEKMSTYASSDTEQDSILHLTIQPWLPHR